MNRKDEIEGKSLIQMRSANCDPEALCIMKDWNDGICNLNIDLNKIKFEHNKIKLNQYGNGMCELWICYSDNNSSSNTKNELSDDLPSGRVC